MDDKTAFAMAEETYAEARSLAGSPWIGSRGATFNEAHKRMNEAQDEAMAMWREELYCHTDPAFPRRG